MPELPEAERARLQMERVLGREIVAVDDRDTYVCRPHAPGEIERALLGRRLGMAGRIDVDEPPAPRQWDRFSIAFAGGGRLALRDKRRLGRAVLEPDFSHVGPDAAEIKPKAFAERV